MKPVLEADPTEQFVLLGEQYWLSLVQPEPLVTVWLGLSHVQRTVSPTLMTGSTGSKTLSPPAPTLTSTICAGLRGSAAATSVLSSGIPRKKGSPASGRASMVQTSSFHDGAKTLTALVSDARSVREEGAEESKASPHVPNGAVAACCCCLRCQEWLSHKTSLVVRASVAGDLKAP